MILIKYACKAKKILNFLRVVENSDEEDFAELEPKIQEIQRESENDEQEIEGVDNEVSFPPQDEGLCGSTNTARSNVPQQSQISSQDSTMWDKKPTI